MRATELAKLTSEGKENTTDSTLKPGNVLDFIVAQRLKIERTSVH